MRRDAVERADDGRRLRDAVRDAGGVDVGKHELGDARPTALLARRLPRSVKQVGKAESLERLAQLVVWAGTGMAQRRRSDRGRLMFRARHGR